MIKNYLLETLRRPQLAGAKKAARFLRGLFFLGRRYKCPCCSWTLRGFVDRHDLIATNSDGYCPRCNAKARHRRVWLYLKEHSSLFSDHLRVLEIAPWVTLAERFQQLPNIYFVGLDLERRGSHVSLVGDTTLLPIGSDSFDVALSIHVLEHIEDDRSAMTELYRVLKPGGWAVIAVPIRLDRPTHEDPSITDPEERARAFGESSHLRYYGADFADRLEAAGFEVSMDSGSQVPSETRLRYGLRETENIFLCVKPAYKSSVSVHTPNI